LIKFNLSKKENPNYNHLIKIEMYSLREGQIDDLPRVLELIQELALYEKAPEQVTNTLEMMKEDGFGPNPVYGMYVCEKDETKEIVVC